MVQKSWPFYWRGEFAYWWSCIGNVLQRHSRLVFKALWVRVWSGAPPCFKAIQVQVQSKTQPCFWGYLSLIRNTYLFWRLSESGPEHFLVCKALQVCQQTDFTCKTPDLPKLSHWLKWSGRALSVTKSPVFKRQARLTRRFGKITHFLPLFCDFVPFLYLSTLNVYVCTNDKTFEIITVFCY